MKAAVRINLEVPQNARNLRLHRKVGQGGQVQPFLLGNRSVSHVYIAVVGIGPLLLDLEVFLKPLVNGGHQALGGSAIQEEGLLFQVAIGVTEQDDDGNRQQDEE